MQGYLLSRPLPAAEIVPWLLEHRRKLGLPCRGPSGDSKTMPLLSMVPALA